MEGEKTTVPLGGKVIPAGMEADADWMNRPVSNEEPIKEDFGEEYREIEKLREELGNVKKIVTSICQPVQTIYTLGFILESNEPNTDKANVEKQIADQIVKRDQIIIELEKLCPLFEKHTDYISYKEGIVEIIKQSKTKFNSKEDNFEFGSLCKKVTSNIFKDQRVLLDKMKAIKKSKQ